MSLTPEESARVEQALADVDYAHLEIARVIESREAWRALLEELETVARDAGRAVVTRALPLLMASALSALERKHGKP